MTEYSEQEIKDFWIYIKYMTLMADSIGTPVVDGPEDISYDAFVQSEKFQKFLDRNGTRYSDDQFMISKAFADKALDYYTKYRRGEVTIYGDLKMW